MAEPEITRDGFYDGRLILAQPARGHRSGTDAVLLAAAVPRAFAGLCVDVGAGVGAAGLGIALACPAARVVLAEVDDALADLADANVAEAGLAGRVAVRRIDVLSRAGRDLTEAADLVVSNPPFDEADRVRPSPTKAPAHVLPASATTADWILACLAMLKPKGTLVLVHRASGLPAILAALERRAGGVTALPVQPEAGRPAHRVIVRALKGSRAPFTLAAPLVLHSNGVFTEDADRLHRGVAVLAW